MSSSPTLRQLQLAELDILRAFTRLCDGEGLRYFLVGGTLLGAVRHGGFIPWDDDVDVAMPRPDYERLSASLGASGDDRYALQTYRTEASCPYVFAKLMRDGTSLRERETEHLPIRHLVSIDVFPLDGAPAGRLPRLVHAWVHRFCRLRIKADTRLTGPKRLLARLISLAPRSWAIGLLEWFARRYPYDKSPYVVTPGGAWGYARESAPRSWFGEGVRVTFEGEQLVAPRGWDHYLTQMYGDYHLPPPLEARNSGHELTQVELDAAPGR
jgi:lipopolysaccharide cholinephosphotransferase